VFTARSECSFPGLPAVVFVVLGHGPEGSLGVGEPECEWLELSWVLFLFILVEGVR